MLINAKVRVQQLVKISDSPILHCRVKPLDKESQELSNSSAVAKQLERLLTPPQGDSFGPPVVNVHDEVQLTVNLSISHALEE